MVISAPPTVGVSTKITEVRTDASKRPAMFLPPYVRTLQAREEPPIKAGTIFYQGAFQPAPEILGQLVLIKPQF